jgi:uncharacterized protein
MKRRQIGVIADTHGLVRAEAAGALQGVDLIIHAGDVGEPEVLTTLRAIAPVVAVRGNVDRGVWARTLPFVETVELDPGRVFVVHDLNDLDLEPAVAGVRAVISGHSHRPSVETQAGILYLNPGSAGPRRFELPVTVALLDLQGEALQARIVSLDREG